MNFAVICRTAVENQYRLFLTEVLFLLVLVLQCVSTRYMWIFLFFHYHCNKLSKNLSLTWCLKIQNGLSMTFYPIKISAHLTLIPDNCRKFSPSSFVSKLLNHFISLYDKIRHLAQWSYSTAHCMHPLLH